jgi:hypothetical protein
VFVQNFEKHIYFKSFFYMLLEIPGINIDCRMVTANKIYCYQNASDENIYLFQEQFIQRDGVACWSIN